MAPCGVAVVAVCQGEMNVNPIVCMYVRMYVVLVGPVWDKLNRRCRAAGVCVGCVGGVCVCVGGGGYFGWGSG